MNVVKEFNGLHGTVATREELQEIARAAKVNGQKYISKNLDHVLQENEEDEFSISLSQEAIEQAPNYALPQIEEASHEEMDEIGLGKAVSPDEIYQYITDLMINTIKKVGYLPWERNWEKTALFNGKQAVNFDSKKGYRGVNYFLLNFEQKIIDGEPTLVAINFENPYFLTFNQIKKYKGSLDKGAKARRVIYFTKLYYHSETRKDGTKLEFSGYNQKKFLAWIKKNEYQLQILKRKDWTIERLANSYIPILKYYNVFHAEDVSGIDWGELPKNPNAEKTEKERMEVAEKIIAVYPDPPKIIFKGDQPAYFPKTDQIMMTPIDAFKNEQFYYSTFFHELVHSTGHRSRLNRGLNLKTGNPDTDKRDYAFEELVAEMGAVFLSAESGILFSTLENSAKYLKGWNRRLISEMKEDNRFFFRAASKSQAAADYILDKDKDGIPAYRGQDNFKNGFKKGDNVRNVSNKKSGVITAVRVDRTFEITYPDGSTETVTEGELRAEKSSKKEPALNAPRHDGIAKEALTTCGRLKAGYKYLKGGKIVKIETAETEKQASTHGKNRKKTATVKASKTVVDFPLKSIKVDEKRFQNRSKLNESVVKNIVENYTPTQFDPIVLWTDPKNRKVYILAGHHRLEAFKRMGKKQIPARFANADYPTEKEAIKYARQLSNANRTLETPMERAKIYREMILAGQPKKEVEKAAGIEGKNKSYILNLAHLSDTGLVIEALERVQETTDKQTEKEIERIADWIGQARRKYVSLTNAHETEMFKFLMDKDASKRITTKTAFLQKIYSIVGAFDFNTGNTLNLNRFKYKTEGEKVYDKEYTDLKGKINDLQDDITAIKERFSNPATVDYVKPTRKDYAKMRTLANEKIADLNAKIKHAQNKLAELYMNKNIYTSANAGQGALFGPADSINISTEKFENFSVSELRNFILNYYNKFLKNKTVPIKQSLSEVHLVNKAGRKIAKGSAAYKAKTAVIEHFEDVLKNSTYNNWGNKKPKDSPDLLGYMNFKSKVLVDGKKRHVRVSVEVYKDRKTLLKSYEVGKKKPYLSKESPKLSSSPNKALKNKITKKPQPTKKQHVKKPPKGLKSPVGDIVKQKAVETVGKVADYALKEATKSIAKAKTTVSKKVRNIGASASNTASFFKVPGEVGKFLQAVERKPAHSVVITLDGHQGAGKTTFLYQMMNAFAAGGNRGVFMSLEEHPESHLAQEKAAKFIRPKNQQYLDIVGDLDGQKEFFDIVNDYEVIFIDSWQKLQRMIGNIRLDEDLRKKFNGKVFVVIFQQTTTGRTKGGAEIVFDGDIIIKLVKEDRFENNYAYFDKNRYTKRPLEKLRYNIAGARFYDPEAKNEPLPDEPQTKPSRLVAREIY